MTKLIAVLVALVMSFGVAVAQPDVPIAQPDVPIDAPDDHEDHRPKNPCDALRAALAMPSAKIEAGDRGLAAQCMAAAQRQGTQGGGEIAATLLSVAGQIVIDRATGVAWGLLSKKLKSAAGCKEKEDEVDRMPATCQVLENLRLQDLLASPQVLLDAAVKDMIAQLGDRLKTAMPCTSPAGFEVCPGEMVHAAFVAWVQGGDAALVESLRAQLVALSVDALQTAADNDSVPAALRGAALFARCAIDANQLRPLGDCRFVAELTPKGRAAILPYATVFDAAIRERTPSAVIEAGTALVHALHPEHKVVLDGIEDTLRGLVDKDWSRASAGAIAVIRYYVNLQKQQKKAAMAPGATLSRRVAALDPTPPPATPEAVAPFADDSKVFRLLAGVGQYAATYLKKDMDPEEAKEARRKAIESLIDSMTDRSQRTDGFVVSIGGQFGAGYAQRRAGDETADGTPFHLAFGVAYDHFCGEKWGVHAMLTLVDASSYVAFADKEFSVVDPDAKAALAMGGTLGIWFAERQTPLFVGGNVTYSPFVDIDAGDGRARGSYQVMGLLGVYVPFIDFN